MTSSSQIWDIVRDGFQTYRQGFPRLFSLSAALATIDVSTNNVALGPPEAWILVRISAYAWLGLAMLLVSNMVHLGRSQGFLDALLSPSSAYWRFLGYSAVFGSIGVTGYGVAVVVKVLPPIVGFVAALLAIAVAVYVMVRMGLYGAIIAFEAKPAGAPNPIERSWSIMSGHIREGLIVWGVACGCHLPGWLCYGIARASPPSLLRLALVLTGAFFVALAGPLLATIAAALYRTVQAANNAVIR